MKFAFYKKKKNISQKKEGKSFFSKTLFFVSNWMNDLYFLCEMKFLHMMRVKRRFRQHKKRQVLSSIKLIYGKWPVDIQYYCRKFILKPDVFHKNEVNEN